MNSGTHTTRAERANERFENSFVGFAGAALMWLAFDLLGARFATGYLVGVSLIVVVRGIYAYGVHRGTEAKSGS